MNNRYKYLFKNMGIMTISNFSSKILVFLLIPLYTNLLTTDEYGTYDLIISTVQIIFPILTCNIVDAVMRFSIDSDVSKKEIATIGFKYICISIGIVGIAIIIGGMFGILPWIKELQLYVFLYYVSFIGNQYLIQFSKGMEKIKEMAISGVVSTFSVCIFNILFLYVFSLGIKGFFAANILGQLIPCIYLAIQIKIWNYLGIYTNKRLQKQMRAYSAPLVVTSIGWWINNTADKYMVTFLCGIAANGLLSIAYKIPSIINILQTIFNQAWQISAIKEHNQKDTKGFYTLAYTSLNILMCIACSVLIILAIPLAKCLFANEFFYAWQYIPFLLISAIINTSSGFMGSILAAEKNSKAMARSSIYGIIANVLLNIILVLMIDVQGAAIATAISSYVILVTRKKAIAGLIETNICAKTEFIWLLLCIQALLQIYTGLYVIQLFIIAIIIFLYKNSICYVYQHIRKGIH